MRRIYLITSCIAVVCAAFVTAGIVQTLPAQVCGVVNVAPRNAFVNVRPTPLAQGGVVRTVVASTQVPASGTTRSSDGHDWFILCGGGYVQDAVVRTIVFTPTVRTPSATFVPQASPTQIRKNSIWCIPNSITQVAFSEQTFVSCDAIRP